MPDDVRAGARARSSGLVGRDDEIDAILRSVEDGEQRIVLVGPPGVGKTALARVVRRCLGLSATRFATLEPSDPLASLTLALGLSEVDDPARALHLAVERLEREDGIVILDGVESMSSAGAALARELAREDVRLIVTSRVLLDLPGERVVPIRPLTRDATLELLVREVARRAPDLVSSMLLEPVVDAVGGLPLAITLTAARIAKIGLRAFAKSGVGALLPNDALAEALGTAWRLLDATTRIDLERLAVFRGGFDDAAAAAILGRDATSLLAELVACSLVERTGDRFTMLEVLRLDAERRARARGVYEPALLEHATHFAKLGELRGDAKANWLRLAEERANLLLAFETAIARAPALAGPLAAVLDPLLLTAGPAWTQLRVLEQALAAVEVHPSAECVDLAFALCRFHAIRGRHALALKTLAEHPCANDAPWPTTSFAFSLRALGRYVEASAASERALAVALANGDARLEAMSLIAKALVHVAQREDREARAILERAIAVARSAKAPRLEALAQINLAPIEERDANAVVAARALAEARALFTSIDDTFHLARVLIGEGRVAHLGHDLERATFLLEGALRDCAEHDDIVGVIEAHVALGQVALARDDERRARLCLEEARINGRRTDDVLRQAEIDGLAEAIARHRGNEPPLVPLEIAEDGHRLVVGGRKVDLRRRGPLRRLIVALARATSPLDVAAMLEAGWPGERMRGESGAARVYMNVRRIRALGLEGFIVTTERGYAFEGLEVRWSESVR